MSAKAPGAGEGGERMAPGVTPGRGRVGKEWTTVEPNSEGALPALAFLGEIRVWGWFVNSRVWDFHVRF